MDKNDGSVIIAEGPEPFGKELLAWECWEFRKYERGPLWYALASLAGIGLLIYAFVSANFLFALIIVMFALVIYLSTIAKPSRLTCRVTETGFVIGESFFPYKDMRHFWIVYEPPVVQTLYIDLKTTLQPRVTIDIEEANPNELRKALGRFVPEDLTKDGEPPADIIGRILKI